MVRADITPDLVAELLRYEPTTGSFTWRERGLHWFTSLRAQCSWNGHYANKPAGCTGPKGYHHIKLLAYRFAAHRLAWAITHGVWPDCIDHINGDTGDNRLCNLRSVTNAENMRNKRKYRNNKTGVNRVVRLRGKYHVGYTVAGKKRHVGVYDTLEEAASVASGLRPEFTERHGL